MEGVVLGFGAVLQFEALLFIFVGTFAGVFVGAIPGLTGAMLIALLLPVTFYMVPLHALAFIVGVYVGAVSGGLITATLLRIPGTVSSLVTTFDGYPMALAGQPGRALGLGITASLFGGVFSWFLLALVAQPLSIWATRFTPFDYFALVMLAFVLIVTLSRGAMVKGLISAAIGFMIALPGIDPTSAQQRLTFDIVDLNAGMPMLPFFVGVFAVGTVFGDILKPPTTEGNVVNASHEGIFMNRAAWRRNFVNLIRSSAIGSGVGVLPAIGSNIASIVAYVSAKTFSKSPERFGKGSEEGIVASEAANNSAVGGALVPTLAMGVPGSFVDVLLLAAFLIHSIQPGPLLFVNNRELVYGLIASYLIANVLMFLIMLASIKFVARLARFPRAYLFPLILIFSVVGAFALDNSAWALWAMLLSGILGFAMEWLKFPLAPLAIAFVLGPLAEQKLRTGLQMTGGSYEPLYSDSTSVGLLGVALAMLLVPLLRNLGRRRSAGP